MEADPFPNEKGVDKGVNRRWGKGTGGRQGWETVVGMENKR